MRYKIVRRRERREDYDEETDPDHLIPIPKSRLRTLYEWDGPSGRYRSPHPYILDRRRGLPAEAGPEDRSKQPSLSDEDQDIQEEGQEGQP